MIVGIYEYCGIQRCGKSTLMMCDLVSKILEEYEPWEIYSNFWMNIDGVHCMNNQALMDEMLRMKHEKQRHKWILFDEVGQELKARSYMDKKQMEVVGIAWQMPKMGWGLSYCSNPGNSADIILRDATWATIMPNYRHGLKRSDDYIECSVIFNYDLRIARGIRVYGVSAVQDLFDSYQPIE